MLRWNEAVGHTERARLRLSSNGTDCVMPARITKTLEVANLPAPVAWLDARNGVVVSVLQAPARYTSHPESMTIEPGAVHVHDATTLHPMAVMAHPGWIWRAKLSPGGSQVVVVHLPDPSAPTLNDARISIWDVHERRELIARDLPMARDCAWWRNRLAIARIESRGRHADGWGPKVELWTIDLERCTDRLDVGDLGADVAAEGDVIAASGCDLHLWWPGSERSIFSLHGSPHGPPGEMGSSVLSRDGRLAAVVHHAWRPEEPRVVIIRVDALEAEPVQLLDPELENVEQLAFNADGSLLAVRISESSEIRIHGTTDGRLVTALSCPGHRAIAWQDSSRLLVGGETLSAWTIA